jgi:pyruvate dehydrogenase E2 component (dihydrolipoamide acetyltransferase)
LNGEWRAGRFEPSGRVNLGLVTSLRRGGLLVPVIADAASRSVADLMAEMRAAAERARTGRLRASELTGATITVSSLGDRGVDSVYGVIFPPQVAMVGIGTVLERPWAVDGMLAVRRVVTFTLAADHRASDGAVGARFLNLISRLLQTPEEL